MPWQSIPSFMAELIQRDAIAARALAFGILCASRAGEVRGARWFEIDLDAQTWLIPPHRMKGKSGREHEHRVSLSNGAIAIVASMSGFDDELIFPSLKGKELLDVAIRALLKRMGHRDITQHGFRTSFRTWVQDETTTPHDVAERCLAHSVGNKVSQSYARSDLLDQRRKVMNAWSDYALGARVGKVVHSPILRVEA